MNKKTILKLFPLFLLSVFTAKNIQAQNSKQIVFDKKEVLPNYSDSIKKAEKDYIEINEFLNTYKGSNYNAEDLVGFQIRELRDCYLDASYEISDKDSLLAKFEEIDNEFIFRNNFLKSLANDSPFYPKYITIDKALKYNEKLYQRKIKNFAKLNQR